METSDIPRRIRRLEFRARRAVNEFAPGAYRSLFRGQGMEFAEVREFQTGDDARIIDWRATARIGHPVVKRFVEERELTLMLLVDGSASCRCGHVRERLLELAAVFAFSALRNHDRVGAMLFSSQPEVVVPPGQGRHQGHRLLRELLLHEPAGNGTDLGAALATAQAAARRGTVFVLLSDFLDRGFDNALWRAALRHDVVAVRVHSTGAQALPPGLLISLADAESADTAMVETKADRAALSQAVAQRGERIDQRLRAGGAEVLAIGEHEDPVPRLARFLARRRHARTEPRLRGRRR